MKRFDTRMKFFLLFLAGIGMTLSLVRQAHSEPRYGFHRGGHRVWALRFAAVDAIRAWFLGVSWQEK